MLPRAASLVTGRAALGGAAAVGAVAPAQTTSQQISRTVCRVVEVVVSILRFQTYIYHTGSNSTSRTSPYHGR